MVNNNEVDIGLVGKRESETFSKGLKIYPLIYQLILDSLYLKIKIIVERQY